MAETQLRFRVAEVVRLPNSHEFGYGQFRLQDIADRAFQLVQSLREVVNQLGDIGCVAICGYAFDQRQLIVQRLPASDAFLLLNGRHHAAYYIEKQTKAFTSGNGDSHRR